MEFELGDRQLAASLLRSNHRDRKCNIPELHRFDKSQTYLQGNLDHADLYYWVTGSQKLLVAQYYPLAIVYKSLCDLWDDLAPPSHQVQLVFEYGAQDTKANLPPQIHLGHRHT